MSAVSNSVMPRSIALWITLREVSRSVRWPKLLQPRPTAETRRPEPPRLRICMGWILLRNDARDLAAFWRVRPQAARRSAPWRPCRSGRFRQRLFLDRFRRHRRRGAQGGRGHAPDRFFRLARNRLAIGAPIVGDRLAPAHGDVNLSLIHISEPTRRTPIS